MAPIRLALFLLAVCRCCPDVMGDIATTWCECNCSWATWNAWSACNNTCFASPQRTRAVWHTNKPGCTGFTDCASSSSGWEYDVCSDVCHNGGTPTSIWWEPCLCQPANYGNSCENSWGQNPTAIDCGDPGDVEHGSVTFSVTTYGGAATYVCDEHYNMTGADPSRTCQSNAVWSGAEPRCAFVNACGSGPCQNGATCRNGLDQYTCICPVVWTGENCEHVVNACGSGPCQNGATCRNGLDEYTCICPVGWTGEHCEQFADATRTSDDTVHVLLIVLLSIVGVTFITLAIILTMWLFKSEHGKTTGSVANTGHLSKMTIMTPHQHFTTSNNGLRNSLPK